MIEAQGDFNRPWLVQGTSVRASCPRSRRSTDRLAADPPARVADVACGIGLGLDRDRSEPIPGVRVDGFDLDEYVDRARVGERQGSWGGTIGCRFHARDVAEAKAGAYDAAVIIEAVHDMTQPVGVLRSVRRMLRPAARCWWRMSVPRTSSPARATIVRLYYGFSIFTCLPAAMAERPTAATGTVMRASMLRDLAAQAGFTAFERLDEPALDALRFYRLSS